jgi:hypothetical protein
MSNIKKLMMSGAGGGPGLDVDDVFSTYLYKGTGSTQKITNGIALADGVGGGTSTKFSGESGNNLRRTSDFTGNSDSTTFTFSAWVINDGDGSSQKTIYSADDGIYAFSVDLQSTALHISGWQGTTQRLYATLPLGSLPYESWIHVLISVDLSSTSNRYVYINDVDKTSQMSWWTYSYDPIEFTRSYHNIGQKNINESRFKGNIAHVYLDYTYRNLSTTSNRRLFIDANGGSTSPSTLSALNPIMYLPMTEDYALGENLGTGGDLGVNGPPTIVDNGTEYLSGLSEGGLVWLKGRNLESNHTFVDTERGATQTLASNTSSQGAAAQTVTAFNIDGFSIGSDGNVSSNTYDFTSWTFRKVPKFFDIVTYTGDNVAGRTVSHNLGVVPGCIIVKSDTGIASNWAVYHRSNTASPETDVLTLNTANATQDNALYWNDTAPTATQFTVGQGEINANGSTYVAYLFAHNDGDGEFGPDADQDIIKCGSYTGTSTTRNDINLGFEPQWLMIKKASGSGSWWVFDNMRGLPTFRLNAPPFWANYTYGESSIGITDWVSAYANGFSTEQPSFINNSGEDFIYVAIRRGPLAPPESATEVFQPNLASAGPAPASPPTWYAGFPSDFGIVTQGLSSSNNQFFVSRLTQGRIMYSDSTAAEFADTNWAQFDNMTGIGKLGANTNDWLGSMWKRAPGFFDVVAYTGNSTNPTNISHNLGVAPEMMWIKMRSSTNPWGIYHSATGNTKMLNFDTGVGYTSNNYFGSTTPTDQVFTLGNSGGVNSAGNTYIAYLFASLDGVSKVGSYTGNGSSQTIDCGFSAGARFVMIKRTDSTGDWYMHDAAQGIIAGNDPYLRLNTNNAQITTVDNIDPANSGFIVNQVSATNINVSGGSYIFYAVA